MGDFVSQPEIVELDTLHAEERAKFLMHLTDDQLYKMVHDPMLVRRCNKDAWYHIALHAVCRLKFPSCRVADRETQKTIVEAQHADLARSFRMESEEVT